MAKKPTGPETDCPQLASNLKRAMAAASMSATDLARASGVSVASLSRILSGQVNPSLGHMVKISAALGVSLDSLTNAETLHEVRLDGATAASNKAAQVDRHAAELRDQTDILVSFVLENTPYSPQEAARLLANAATGSWVESWTEQLTDSSRMLTPRPIMAMQTSRTSITVDVAFPQELIEAGSVISLISVIAASCTSTGARIDDIRIPPILLRTFQGPTYGIGGLRDRNDKYGRPLLSATMRPIVGLSPRMYGLAAFETLKGGIDFTCDPTLLHDMPSNRWRDRFNYLADAVADAHYETNEIKTHAANVTAGTVEAMLERAELASQLNLGAVMIDSGAAGWAAVQSLAAFCHKNGLLLCAMGGRALNNGPLSQQLVAKLLRLAGCDVVSVGSPLRGNAVARRNVKGITRALTQEDMPAFPEGQIMFDQPTCGIANAMPACGGGHNAWHFPQLLDAFGPDVMIQCGGSTMGHPWGSLAGATANRVAIEALMQARISGQNLATDGRQVLEQAARNSPELVEALRFWREGSFLFGVVSNDDKDKLEGVVIKSLESARQKRHLKSVQNPEDPSQDE